MAKNINIGEKIIKEQNVALEAIRDELKAIKKSQAGMDSTTQEYLGLQMDYSDKIGEAIDRSRALSEITNGVYDTAAFVSKNLGMEEGTKRILNDKLTEMVYYSADLRTAIKKGDSEIVKEQMVDLLTKQLDTMKFSSDAERERHKQLIEELNENFDTAFDWDKISDRADNIFFPVTQKFWSAAEAMRSAAHELPIVGRMFSLDMVEHYRQGWQEAMNIMDKHIQSILAPIDMLVGPFVGAFKAIMFLSKTMMTKPSKYEVETAKYTKMTAEAIQRSNEEADKDRKREMYLKRDDKSLFGKIISIMTRVGVFIAAVAAGLIAGAFAKTVLIPFQVVQKVMTAFWNVFISIKKLQPLFKAIVMWVDDAVIGFKLFLSKIPVFGKLGTVLAKIVGLYSNFMNYINGILAKVTAGFVQIKKASPIVEFFKKFTFIGKILKFIGKFTSMGIFVNFLKYFKTGMKYLGWPLQILMSVMDFMKGWKETEGGIFEKLLGGIREAVMGFIEMPIRLLSWVGEKVLGLFGVEVSGIADMILEKIRDVFSFEKMLAMFEYWFSLVKGVTKVVFMPFNALISLFAFVIGFFKTEGSILEKTAGGLKTLVRYWATIPLKIIEWVVGTIADWFDIDSIFGMKIDGMADTILDFVDNFIDRLVNFFGDLFGFVSKRLNPFNILKSNAELWAEVESKKKDTEDVVNKVDSGNKTQVVYVGSPTNARTIGKHQVGQSEMAKDMAKEISKTNNNIKEGNMSTQQVIQQNSNVKAVVQKKEIPDEIESMGVMFMNKSWGMG